MAEQDHQHHPGRDDAEEGGDLELLQQVGRRQEGGVALGRQGVDGAQGRIATMKPLAMAIGRLSADSASVSSVSPAVQPVLHPEHAGRAEADRHQQHHALEQRLQQRRDVEQRKQNEIARSTRAPKIEPMAPPEPPNSEVPPITTAAIEFSV